MSRNLAHFFSLNAMAQTTLASEIAGVSTVTRGRMRKGIAVATKLSSEKSEQVLASFIEVIRKGSTSINLRPLGTSANLSQEETTDLFIAFFGLLEILSKVNASIDEFVAASRDQLFDSKDEAGARILAKAISESGQELRTIVDRGAIAAETLPSLTSFDVSVDLRMAFENDKIREGVPVAIVHIGTDAQPELWIQLSRGDLEFLLEKLHEVAKQMDLADSAFRSLAPVKKP